MVKVSMLLGNRLHVVLCGGRNAQQCLTLHQNKSPKKIPNEKSKLRKGTRNMKTLHMFHIFITNSQHSIGVSHWLFAGLPVWATKMLSGSFVPARRADACLVPDVLDRMDSLILRNPCSLYLVPAQVPSVACCTARDLCLTLPDHVCHVLMPRWLQHCFSAMVHHIACTSQRTFTCSIFPRYTSTRFPNIHLPAPLTASNGSICRRLNNSTTLPVHSVLIGFLYTNHDDTSSENSQYLTIADWTTSPVFGSSWIRSTTTVVPYRTIETFFF